jgi:hypothetical protein
MGHPIFRGSFMMHYSALYIPTHRDEAAMDGAPDLSWLVYGEATAKTKSRSSAARRMTNKNKQRRKRLAIFLGSASRFCLVLVA